MRREFLHACAVLALFESGAYAFSASSMNQKHRASCLQLVPEQANQLVAAYTAGLKDFEDLEDLEDEIANMPPKINEQNPRNFVQRAFNLPARKHPKEDGDVVVYPLVGFTFCQNGDRVVALPTKSNVSCRLLPISHKEAVVYGWYSPVCKLDMYAPEDSYCQAPSCSQENAPNKQ